MKTLITITTVMLACATWAQQSVKHPNSIAVEQQQIINTVTSIFASTDARAWDKVEDRFSDHVVLDYTSMAGGTPANLSPQQITSAWKSILPGFRSTHHQVGNFTVDINGPAAQVHHHGLALHYLPNETGNNVWVVVGTYDFKLKRNGNEWKVTAMKFNLQKQEGNLQLPALAQQNVQKGILFSAAQVPAAGTQVIEQFYQALERLDIPAFLKLWADDGKQLMPLSPDNFPKQLNGKEAIYNQYKGLPENYNSMKFPRKYVATEDPNKIIVQYAGIIPLKKGGEYNNNYVGLFELADGKVKQFTEYFDPFILQDAFGKQLESNFNVKNQGVSQEH